MIGKIINYRYEVLEKIGDGPLFSVYKSRDKVLNRLVALKVLRRELVENRTFAESVTRSYGEVSGLAHPNIARVIDADCPDADCFVATEHARGVSVKERIRRAGAMGVSLSLDIIMPVLEALEYAHANRVVHGDIGSQDIIVSPDGEVKLTDFGLRKALDESPEVADRYSARSVQYEAPEIAEGHAPSPTSDLYSIGVVLYEMLTGQTPFDAPTSVAVAMMKMKETPTAPRLINTAVPKSLNDIVMKAIETAPDNRYQDAGSMLADLRAISEALRVGKPTSVPAYAPMTSRAAVEPQGSDVGEESSMKSRFVWLTALFVLVVMISLGATMLIMGRDSEIRVPPLLGKTWDEAQLEAQNAGITLVDDGTASSDMYPAGQICSVIPPANAMVPKSNPIVRVKISSGPSQVKVPDLSERSEADATELVVRAGFAIGKIKEEYSDKVPVNYVVSQDPPAGMSKAPGSTVDLVVSLGPKPSEETPPEPDMSGTDSESVKRKFTVDVEVPADADGPQEVKIEVSDDRGDNTVYEQAREPGDKFPVPVTVHGSSARIRVYVGGELVSDDTY
ncbi:MAG: protein kinase [Armatimonadetes bacterium]|nr:protein kinase [Armatimonadota bacterium]